MHRRTTRTLVIRERNDRNRSIRVTKRGLIVCRDRKHRRLRRDEEYLNRRTRAQLFNKCTFRLAYLNLLEILPDRVFGLRKVAADTLFILLVEELRLLIGNRFWLHFCIEQS